MLKELTQESGISSGMVSILIPCYNAEQWIGQCIQSALDQTWPNKEIIVTDDGSSDSSVDVIRRFGDRIQFHLSPHSGGNVIRNKLTRLASGEWLQYLDADDYLLPDKINAQMSCLSQSAADVGVIYSPVIIHDAMQAQADYVAEIKDSDEALTFIRWGPFNTGGLLFRRNAVLQAGGWKEDQQCCQEHELLLRLQVVGCRFQLHNEPGAVYRQHSSLTVSRRDPLLTIRTRMELTDRLAEHLKVSGRLTRAHKDALFAARMESARGAYRLNSPLAEELCKKAEEHGLPWVSGSPALPTSYQLALRFTGFAKAERIAAWVRERHAASGTA